LPAVSAWEAALVEHAEVPGQWFVPGRVICCHGYSWTSSWTLTGAGILQQAGVVYQLRHIELQHRLATRDDAKR